jgi:hypothetical protein
MRYRRSNDPPALQHRCITVTEHRDQAVTSECNDASVVRAMQRFILATMLPFCFEHVFRARSASDVFEAYFDATHQVEQDRCLSIVEREVRELEDRGDVLRRTCRVVPRRQLPAIVKPLIPGQLDYIETAEWDRRTDTIAIAIRPSMLGGRVLIDGKYQLASVGADAIQRRYAGAVSVDIAWLGSRIERGIIAEIGRALPAAATCTQQWLDRHTPAARA